MDDSRFFIIGANGQLGTALRQLYPNAKSADVSELDITNEASVSAFDWSNVDVILNAAAYTNVDGAETTEGRQAAWAVNAKAVQLLAKVAIEHGITLVHISSDYVFDGTKTIHTEDEGFAPLGVYAQSKAAGDIAASLAPKHYIVRTSWVVGDGKNFIEVIKGLAEKDVAPSVVNDQIGRLTFTQDLAEGIKHLIDTNAPYGTYNLTNDGDSVSWADVAKWVYEVSGKDPDMVTGVTTEDYYRGKEGIAPRPLQSALSLDKIKAAGFTPRDLRVAFDEYMASTKENA